jgi:hypothetical protein
MSNHSKQSQIVTAAIVPLVLLLPAVGTPTLAQDAERGTTLVCVGRADGLALEEWTPEQIDQYGLFPVHPETGDCQDPAGLWVDGWTDQVSWLCSLAADSGWSGPTWVHSHYRYGEQVPPDPSTGTCPTPRSRFSEPSDSEVEKAAATAVHMTELEVAADYDRLYAWMHPDSKAVVPRSAMEGLYREVFATRPPVWMTVDDVRIAEWTWGVTGTVYPGAAEVTFHQRFADRAETDGVTHLVRDNGVWRWFFGRDRAFVEEQIARFGGGGS